MKMSLTTKNGDNSGTVYLSYLQTMAERSVLISLATSIHSCSLYSLLPLELSKGH
jgi:hypothetical protein